MPRRRRGGRGGFDAATMSAAFSRPGIDPRQWISYGLVSPQQNVDGDVVDSVEFDDVAELGPLVNVRLQPSNIEVRCRVGMRFAGAGEGEYSPFVEGDEVLVAIPEGDERAGCAILCRLANSLDVFPSESIAGQDPTNNTFAFERRRTPYVQEYASSYMLRVAATGAFLLMSDAGILTIRDGSKGALQMGPDIFGYTEGVPGEVDPEATPTPTALLQLDLTGRRLSLQMDDALLQMNGSDADNNAGNVILAVPAECQVILGTNVAAERVATMEGVVNFVEKMLVNLAAQIPGPITGAQIVAWLVDAASGFPTTPAIAVGTPIVPTTLPGLTAAMQLADVKVKPPVVGGIQADPGMGAGLFKTG